METKTILAVCMLDSVHTARWLEQFKDEGLVFILFPARPHLRVHPSLVALIRGCTRSEYKLVPIPTIFGIALWSLDRFCNDFFRSVLLRMSIRRFKPDFVHSLEFQGAGYLSLRAFGSIGGDAPNWIVTNWGSDIYWFERFPQHRKKIIQILSKADRYSAECVRDVELAIKLGFRGHVLPVLPNAGGFSDEILSRNLLGFESRKVIAVKGYHGWAGRAKVALGAIGQMADELSDYEVIVFSADRDVAKLARKISKQTGMTITCHRKKKLTHDQVLEILAAAVVYIGVSRTDGISTSMLEAMALGAIPIQTSSACCSEWFDETGVAIDEISTTSVQMAIRRGISLAKDPINIQQNRHTVKQRAEEECIKKMALTFYE